MSFRITGLSPAPFRHPFGLSDEELARHNARRYVADKKPDFPDRVGVRDAEGTALAPAIERLLANDAVAYLHAHFAKRGCYAARIERA